MNNIIKTLAVFALCVIISSCASTSKQEKLSNRSDEQRPQRDYIRLVILPEEASGQSLSHQIYLDNTYIGDYYPSDFSDVRGMSLRLEVGEHVIRILSEGFQPEERQFVVREGVPKQMLRFNLKQV